MLDEHDQLELISLIEGELDSHQAAVLRKRLAKEPRALAMVERMMEDRATLRAVGSPELPEDFVARLEPLLARPMLIEQIAETVPTLAGKPGAYRRQHKRSQIRMRWGRLAAAAVLLCAVIAGTWAGMNGLLGPDRGTTDDSTLALNDAATNDAVALNDAVSASHPLSGTIHHAAPELERLSATALTINSNAGGESQAVRNKDDSLPGKTVIAQFAIVIASGGAAEMEQAIAAALQVSEMPHALVRNFNFDEAQRLAREWAVAQGSRGSSTTEPLVASGSSGNDVLSEQPDYARLAERVRLQLNTSSATSSEHQASGQLVGTADLAPSLEEQLNFSSRGATHTVTIPIAYLSTFTERIVMHSGLATSLRLLTSNQDTDSIHAADDNVLALWMTDGPKVRQIIEQLQITSPDAVVQIPVVIVHSD